ncbi:ExbD/TolR family protein [Paracoccus aminophilus]|uniref:Biopolymer transport protein ExbD/TolR n=1 Tax=Paracoccus aminophilus JCM 7686 TaxID=1367847 RepID=S5Y1Z9_PARAH|nr:biopolymer transporter ExbD [Paracoccus aminophilus]AGT11482.1 hypothetical protein JCM7686_pAMI6p152 [Paracoccus aminophilus JCM 7686]
MTVNLPKRRKLIGIDVSLAIVNIVLLLIFFFVVSGQEFSQAREIDLSETSRLPLDRLPKPILVIDRAGGWSLDGTPVEPELLSLALPGVAEGGDLFLMIDRRAPASQLIAVLNRPELKPYRLRLVTVRQGSAP